MDILSWTKLNPKITVESVTKRFFNRYCYKLDLEIHGSAFLRYPDVPIHHQLEHRKKMNRRINFAGTWRNYISINPNKDDIKVLNFLLDNYITCPNNFKFRIEEPNLSVYAESEEDLFQLANLVYKTVKHNKHIKRIHRPKTQEHLDLLLQGFTVKQNKKGFKHKIMLREGRYNLTVKQQLLSYLKNCDKDVMIPKHLEEALEKPYDSFWGSYFYSNDLGLVTMISLIHPNLVRSVETYQNVNK